MAHSANFFSSSNVTPMDVDPPTTPPRAAAPKRLGAHFSTADDGSPVRERLKRRRIQGSPDAGMHVDPLARQVFESPKTHPSPMRAPPSSPFEQLVTACRFRMRFVTDPSAFELLNTRLLTILQQLPPDQASEELALFLYYIEKPEAHHPALLHPSASLFDQRVDEILQNIKAAKTDAKVEDCGPLPPCVKQLILRAFVRSCILPTGRFIPEGAAVVIRMLHSPIGGELEVEQYRTELVRIFAHIRDNPHLYQPIFEQARSCDTSQLPPLVRKLIGLDWQLEGEEITPAQLSWSLLKALLEPNQQLMHHRNCYAVASLNYASIGVPHQFLTTLLSLVLTGKVTCGSDQLPVIIPSDHLRNKDVLDGLDESDDKADTAQRVTALLNNMLRFYLVHGAMISFLNSPHEMKKCRIIDNIISAATSVVPMSQGSEFHQDFSNQVKEKTAIAESVSFNESHGSHIGLLKKGPDGEWTPLSTVHELQVHLSSCTTSDLVRRWIDGKIMKDLLIQNIQSSDDPKNAAELRREARLSGTLGFPTLGGGGEKVLDQLFGIRCQKSNFPPSDPRELLEQLYQFAHHVNSVALMTDYKHDFLFDGTTLRSLTVQSLHELLDQQPYGRPFAEQIRSIAAIEWRQILNKLGLTLNQLNVFQHMKFEGTRHPFHIAASFHRLLKTMGDYRFSLFQVYCTIAKQIGHQVAIPFANDNTHVGDNPEALGYDQLAVAYSDDTGCYETVILNEHGPCRIKNLSWERVTLFYS